MSGHTPGPWQYEPGGGHAYNRIVGSESVQINGWPERYGGYSNASYSERVCENLGDPDLPGPKANIALICAAPDLLQALRRAVEMLRDVAVDIEDGIPPAFRHKVIAAIDNAEQAASAALAKAGA